MESITASEARQMMTKAPAYQLEGILLRIAGASQRGCGCISFYDEIHPDNVSALIQKGFEVQKLTDEYKISW